MPRIAATLAVSVVVACSLGWNIHRYPSVHEMVAAGLVADSPADAEAEAAAGTPAAEGTSSIAPPEAESSPPGPQRGHAAVPRAAGAKETGPESGEGGPTPRDPAPLDAEAAQGPAERQCEASRVEADAAEAPVPEACQLREPVGALAEASPPRCCEADPNADGEPLRGRGPVEAAAEKSYAAGGGQSVAPSDRPAERPLVPVPPVTSADRAAADAAFAAAVTPLPPVDPSVRGTAFSRDPLPDGTVPIYPSTDTP